METSPNNPDAREAARKLADAVATALIAGKPAQQVTADLAAQGWKEEDARAFVDRIDAARRDADQALKLKAQLRRGLVMHLIMGILWIILGLGVMATSTPQRDLGGLGVAVIALGAFEIIWSVRSHRRLS